jgi:DNA-binding XRE family transcriptional regulator
MGAVIGFPKRVHVRASAGRRAAKSAKASSVTSLRPRSSAKRTNEAQWGAGIPPDRVRQLLTVESLTASAAATWPVPPSASMIDPGVMPANIVRTLRTCQEFATRETTILDSCGPIGSMTDDPKIIGQRLKALRLALDFHSQVAFAAEIGVEKNTYNPWEKGTRPLTFVGACLIRNRFRIPLDYLFYGDPVGLPAWLHQALLKQSAA